MTLIEALVWIAVFTCAMIALTESLLYFYRTDRYAINEAFAVSSAQHAMDIAVRAIRTASYASTGAYPVISIAPNQISFYANVNEGDPLIQQVRFFVQGTSLEEGVIEPSGSPFTYANPETITDLTDYAQNLTVGTSTFLYYDQNGNQITNYAQFQNVRFVTINLIVDASTSSLPTQLTLTESAALRNVVTH
jgi:type II secretory pathway pseudopilin PulG